MATQIKYEVSDNGVVREANPAEVQAIEDNKAMFAADESKRIQTEAAKAIAQSKLEALGLTPDDLKALGL